MGDTPGTRDGRPNADRIQMSSATADALSDPSCFGSDGGEFVLGGHRYTPDRAVARGFKGIVWRMTDEYGVPHAVKLATDADYADRSFHSEVSLRRNLPSPLFPRCAAAGYWTTPKIPGERFVATVEDWVEGLTLEEFISDPSSVDVMTLVQFVRGITSALAALESAGLAHDDLHSKNVMFRRTRPGEGFAFGLDSDQLWTVVVVDTGSLKKHQRTVKDVDDVTHIARHIVAIHNVLRRKSELTIRDRRFLRECLQVIRGMTENDPGRRLCTAESIAREFEQALSRAQQPLSRPQGLTTPFDYISAEQISSDRVLLELFTTAPWMKQVAGPNPILLTGPRGCGKSMLFRWLALRTHLNSTNAIDFDLVPITGVYVSCTSDLQNRLGWIRSKEQAEERQTEIVHYFNLLLTRELLYTLDLVSRRADAISVFGLGQAEQAEILEFVAQHISGVSRPLLGTCPLSIAISRVEREMFRSHRRMLRSEPWAEPTSAAFLGDLTSLITRTMPHFDRHRIAFLLDDFSTHRVPEHVQRLLGPIVWERRASHVFKLSSEKYGTTLDYEGGGTADLARERDEIDCGKEYIDMSDRQAVKTAQEFATNLLRNRLRLAGWVGSPEELIGDSPQYNEFVRALRAKGAAPNYHGLAHIAELCSGDVATLLLIYRRILRNRDKTMIARVSPGAQDKAITDVSRELLHNIIPHRPFGREMHRFALAFGTFASRCLREAREISDGRGGTEPREVPRIEVDASAEIAVSLTDDQRLFAEELIKRAVFIEMELGRSRRNNVTTLRWHFRRVYMPAFRGPLRKNDAVKISASQFEWLLKDPEEALDVQLRSRQVHEPSAVGDTGGADPLFPLGDQV